MGDRDYVRDGGYVKFGSNARKEGFGRGRMGRDDVSI
jgi:hypothetical protein